MWRVTVETIDDIDVQLGSARWRLLHSAWEEKAENVNRAQGDIDVLLERRYVLMQASVAGTDQSTAALQPNAHPGGAETGRSCHVAIEPGQGPDPVRL